MKTDFTFEPWGTTLDGWKKTILDMAWSRLPAELLDDPNAERQEAKNWYDQCQGLDYDDALDLMRFIWSESFALQKECVVDYQNLPPVGAMGYDEAFVAFEKKRKALHDLTWASDRLRFIYGAPHANAHHTMTAEQQAELIIAQCQDVDFMKETLRAGMLFVVYDNLLIGGNARQGAMMETDMWLFGRLTNVPEASHQLNNPELVDLFDAGTEDVISLIRPALTPHDNDTIAAFLTAPSSPESDAALSTKIATLVLQLKTIERLYDTHYCHHILPQSAVTFYDMVHALLVLTTHRCKVYITQQDAKPDGVVAFTQAKEPKVGKKGGTQYVSLSEQPLFGEWEFFTFNLGFIFNSMDRNLYSKYSNNIATPEQVIRAKEVQTAAFKAKAPGLVEQQLALTNILLTESTYPYTMGEVERLQEPFKVLYERYGSEYFMKELLPQVAGGQVDKVYPQAALLIQSLTTNTKIDAMPTPAAIPRAKKHSAAPAGDKDDATAIPPQQIVMQYFTQLLSDITTSNDVDNTYLEFPTEINTALCRVEASVLQDLYFAVLTQLLTIDIEDKPRYKKLTSIHEEVVSYVGDFDFFLPERPEKNAELINLLVVGIAKYDGAHGASGVFRIPWSLNEMMNSDVLRQTIADTGVLTKEQDVLSIALPHLIAQTAEQVQQLSAKDLSTFVSQLNKVERTYEMLTPVHVLPASAQQYMKLAVAAQHRKYELLQDDIAAAAAAAPNDEDKEKKSFVNDQSQLNIFISLSTSPLSNFAYRPPYDVKQDDERFVNTKKNWCDAFLAVVQEDDKAIAVMLQICEAVLAHTTTPGDVMSTLKKPFSSICKACGKEKCDELLNPVMEALSCSAGVVQMVAEATVPPKPGNSLFSQYF